MQGSQNGCEHQEQRPTDHAVHRQRSIVITTALPTVRRSSGARSLPIASAATAHVPKCSNQYFLPKPIGGHFAPPFFNLDADGTVASVLRRSQRRAAAHERI